MMGGNRPNGYTIVEALIFLAVSAGLLVSALAMVSGQQRRTEFNQAAQDIRSRLDDIANDITNGYYTNANDFSCSADQFNPSAPPIIGPGPNNQGANVGCIFLGRAVQFSPSGQNQRYTIHTVVGRQYSGANLSQVVNSFAEALPRSTYQYGGMERLVHLENGLNFRWIEYVDSSGVAQRGSMIGVGFFADLGEYEYDAGGSLSSGAQHTVVAPIVGTTADNEATFANRIANVGAIVNRPIRICFNSGGTRQHAIISLSSDGGRLTSDLTISGGTC